MDFKSYEAKQIGSINSTTMETLTSYYICNKCNNTFTSFNELPANCRKCGNNDMKEISVFDYFTNLKKNAPPEEYKKEFKKKKERENTMIDLVGLGKFQKMRKFKKGIN